MIMMNHERRKHIIQSNNLSTDSTSFSETELIEVIMKLLIGRPRPKLNYFIYNMVKP